MPVARSTYTSSKKIRGDLKLLWPELRHIWLTDPFYLYADDAKIKKAFDGWADEIPKYKPKANVTACEEFALFCHAFVKNHQIETYDDKYNWAFGECITSRLLGFDCIHSANIYITNKGVHLFEPQTGAFWKANPDEDYVFFVKM